MAVTPGLEHARKAIGWAARDTSGVLSPFNFTRRYSFQPLQFSNFKNVSCFSCSLF